MSLNPGTQPKADVIIRLVAALIDGVLQGIVIAIIPVLGWLIAAAYMLLKDGLFEGQSIGKKLMKMRVIQVNGRKVDFAVSAGRNLIYAVPILIGMIPVAGPTIGGILALVVVIVEAVTLLVDKQGIRMGDKWAKTQVILEK